MASPVQIPSANPNSTWNSQIAFNYFKLSFMQSFDKSQLPLIDVFKSQFISYGKGFQNAQIGFIKPETFNESTRFQNQPNYAETSVEKIEDKIELQLTLTTRHRALLSYDFANPQDLSDFEVLYKQRLQDSFILNKYAFLLKVFHPNGGHNDDVMTTEQRTLASKLNGILKTRTFNLGIKNAWSLDKRWLTIVKKLWEIYQKMTLFFGNEFTMDNTHKAITDPKNLVIIAPLEMQRELLESSMNVYHEDIFKILDKLVPIHYLPIAFTDIFMFDKRALIEGTRLESVTSMDYGKNLQHDTYFNFFGNVGIYKKFHGVHLNISRT